VSDERDQPPGPPPAPPAPDAEAEKAKAEAAAKAREAAAKAKAAHDAAEAAKPAWERDPAVPQWTDAAADPLAQALRARHGESIESARSFAGDLALKVKREAIREVAATLKAEGYTYLVDICGADYPKREPRFEVVYHLYSRQANRRVRLKVATEETTPVPTLCPVFRAANWPEREVYDMYGVRFAEHPDMTRILLWDGFNGYPLRKDFPVEGIDTGVAIYPEYYQEGTGPINKAGTGWLVKESEEKT
jgi:NADH-quinone oxidoreductase subunit C